MNAEQWANVERERSANASSMWTLNARWKPDERFIRRASGIFLALYLTSLVWAIKPFLFYLSGVYRPTSELDFVICVTIYISCTRGRCETEIICTWVDVIFTMESRMVPCIIIIIISYIKHQNNNLAIFFKTGHYCFITIIIMSVHLIFLVINSFPTADLIIFVRFLLIFFPQHLNGRFLRDYLTNFQDFFSGKIGIYMKFVPYWEYWKIHFRLRVRVHFLTF